MQAPAPGAGAGASDEPAAVRSSGDAGGFDPDLYAAVYLQLLRHRRAAPLRVTLTLPVQGSVYDLLDITSELTPTSEDVERVMAEVGALPEAEIEHEVANWFRI